MKKAITIVVGTVSIVVCVAFVAQVFHFTPKVSAQHRVQLQESGTVIVDAWKTFREPVPRSSDAVEFRNITEELRGIRIQLDRLNTNIERFLEEKTE